MDPLGATRPADRAAVAGDRARSGLVVPAGWHVEIVDETGSTNSDLLAAAATGAPDRTVRMARHQTAGRGRLDRRWEAPPGSNLLVSVLFRRVPPHPVHLTWSVALAARRAIAALTPVDARLKWPNDLVVASVDGDRKLAGVLAQAGPALDHVVVGIGVNVGWGIDGAATLAAACTPEALLGAMLSELDQLLAELDADPAPGESLHHQYRAASATIGRAVRVELPGGSFVAGHATDVELDGRLVVVDECAITHRFDVGDVVHLRPEPDASGG